MCYVPTHPNYLDLSIYLSSTEYKLVKCLHQKYKPYQYLYRIFRTNESASLFIFKFQNVRRPISLTSSNAYLVDASEFLRILNVGFKPKQIFTFATTQVTCYQPLSVAIFQKLPCDLSNFKAFSDSDHYPDHPLLSLPHRIHHSRP